MFFKKSKGSNRIDLGVLEAEGESNSTSSVKLSDVFFDDLAVIEQLSSQKFVVVGRKGAGKSALANYIHSTMENSPTDECRIIKHDSIERELKLQGLDSGSVLGLDFYKWLVMVNLIDLLVAHELVFEDLKSFDKLKEFLEVNRGGIKITEQKITNTELTHSNNRESSFGVDAKPLKSFMKVNGMTTVKNLKNSPTIYEILSDLEKVIGKLLACAYNSNNNNTYCLVFDDLDIGFQVSKQESVDNLISLLRSTKEINASWNRFNFKCIVLLRDDVERLLVSRESDLNKYFGSYSIPLNWYTQGEEAPELKSFIERRISRAFKEAQDIDTANWVTLTNSSFKEVLDRTFCRPRDFIAYFSPLSEREYSYPLTKEETDKLAVKFGSYIKEEFNSELSSFYSDKERDAILNALNTILTTEPTVGEIIPKLNAANLDGEKVLGDLYDRSFIGMRNDKGHVFFKYKSLAHHTFGHKIRFAEDQKLLVHYIFEKVFREVY
ncbi:conserved hypothetical protein [Vibrio owensii]|uniref:ATP-binding protein n=1 Tax=Vibrio owensii TaxID=696485 RepID=A0AAU9QDE5_9VIBR|nr:conserved hypothetical protein [Vibrio owensii]